MAKLTMERACELLGAAAGGTLVYNNEFKAACLQGVQVMRDVQKLVARIIERESKLVPETPEKGI